MVKKKPKMAITKNTGREALTGKAFWNKENEEVPKEKDQIR